MTKMPITITKGPIYPSTLTIQFNSRQKGDFFCHRLKPNSLFINLHLQLRRRIRFILLQNRQGKTRLAKYYLPLEDSEKHKVEYEVILVTGILHAIVFHLALGLVRPKDIDLELFEITYVSDFRLTVLCM